MIPTSPGEVPTTIVFTSREEDWASIAASFEVIIGRLVTILEDVAPFTAVSAEPRVELGGASQQEHARVAQLASHAATLAALICQVCPGLEETGEGDPLPSLRYLAQDVDILLVHPILDTRPAREGRPSAQEFERDELTSIQSILNHSHHLALSLRDLMVRHLAATTSPSRMDFAEVRPRIMRLQLRGLAAEMANMVRAADTLGPTPLAWGMLNHAVPRPSPSSPSGRRPTRPPHPSSPSPAPSMWESSLAGPPPYAALRDDPEAVKAWAAYWQAEVPAVAYHSDEEEVPLDDDVSGYRQELTDPTSFLEAMQARYGGTDSLGGGGSYGPPPTDPSVGGRCGVHPDEAKPLPRDTRSRGRAPTLEADPTMTLPVPGEGGLGRGSEEEGDDRALPSSSLAPDVLERLSTMEARMFQQQQSIDQLMELASRLLLERGRERSSSPPRESTTEVDDGSLRREDDTGDEVGDVEEAEVGSNLGEDLIHHDNSVGSAQREVAVLQLSQEKRKENLRLLNRLLSWGKDSLVAIDRAQAIQSVLPRRYGKATYTSGGTPNAIYDALAMYQRWSLPPPPGVRSTPRCAYTSMLPFAATLMLWGGSGRAEGTHSMRVRDYKPLREGEDKTLINVTIMSVTQPPTERQRTPPSSMLEFREAALAMAYVMGQFLGPRVEHELHVSIQTIYDRGIRSPLLMPVPVACHLLDQLVSMVLEAIYAEACSRQPMDVGTDSLNPAEIKEYSAAGWGIGGTTFLVRLTSPFWAVWYLEPLQAASLTSGKDRAATVLRLMGVEAPSPAPPKGGPTGATVPPPPPVPAPAPPVSHRPNGSAYIRRAVYEEAERALLGKSGDKPICFRSLCHVGCTRSPCPMRHLPVTLATLQSKARGSSTLQAVLEFHGGAKGCEGAPLPGKAGRESPLSSDDEEDEPSPLGGRSNGIQVPYLSYISHCYPGACLTDARSAVPVPLVDRPPAVHPDARPRPFLPTSLLGCAPPSMTRTAGDVFQVTSPSPEGTFTVQLGPFSFDGTDLGQSFVWKDHTLSHACVVLAWATALSITPQALFSHFVTSAYELDRSMGPPAPASPPTALLARAMAHDVAASLRSGHALDSLLPVYMPPPELADRVVLLLHYQGCEVAVDIISGMAASAESSVAFCLQRRGSPGHMMPLTSTCSVASLTVWLTTTSIPIRHLTASGWRTLIADDMSGPSASWLDHAVCDVCMEPRHPLPPCPL